MLKSEQILVVDDDVLMCNSLCAAIRRKGYEVKKANNGFEALEKLSSQKFAVVITDIKMPEMSGLELLTKIKERSPDTAVVMITAYGAIDTAIEAMKQGAFDYVLKPFPTTKIIEIIEKIAGGGQNRWEGVSQASHAEDFPDIITSDPKMLKILDMVDTVGKSDATVFIYGESGTGKELIARAIHSHSHRTSKPFVAVNCAALPQDLLESELFGHERGSFTGAIARKLGKFDLANGGTLLLDEVSELSMPLQAKLLRAIQEREIDRIGGTEPVKIDVRIISTTNENLQNLVKSGKFREDLFYRLCVIPIELPPIRERREDIVLLAKYFFREFCRQNKRPITNISQSALEKLKMQEFKGNVRELRNIMERAVILCKEHILMPHHLFPEDIQWEGVSGEGVVSTHRRKPASGVGELTLASHAEDVPKQISFEVGASIYEVEKQLILKTLKEVGGNKSAAAKILGLTAKTIRNKLRQYKIAECEGF